MVSGTEFRRGSLRNPLVHISELSNELRLTRRSRMVVTDVASSTGPLSPDCVELVDRLSLLSPLGSVGPVQNLSLRGKARRRDGAPLRCSRPKPI